MSRGVKNFFYSALVAATSLFHSCEKPESPEDTLPYSNNNPSLNEKARTLDNEQISRTHDYGNRNLYFSEPLDKTYELGTILGSEPRENLPYGLNVEITAFSPDRKKVSVHPVSLDEAIEDGAFSFDKYLSQNDIDEKSSKELYSAEGVYLKSVNSRGFNFVFDNVVYDLDGNPNTPNDQGRISGEFSVDINPYVRADLNKESIYASAGINLDGHAEIYFSANSNSNFSKEVPVWSKYLRPMTILVSGWPVVFVPKVEVTVGANADLESRLYTGITDDFSSHAGISWTGGGIGWEFSKTFKNDFNFHPPEIDLNVDASAYVKVAIDLGVYGGPGVYGLLKTSLGFDANVSKNPWWGLNGNLTASLGINPSFLSGIIPEYEREIFNITKDIADAKGPFLLNPPEENLDSIIIQPGPEGKDAWLKAGKISNPECTKTSDYSSTHPNDSIIKSSFQYTAGCGFAEGRIFIQPPLDQLPQDMEIFSARLDLYGFTGSNYIENLPTFSFSKIIEPWTEQSINWENQPQASLIKKVNFPNGETQWNSIDITSTVQEWVANNSNHGIEISVDENESGGNFYSSDNPDEEHRPRLVVYYENQNN